jgi:DNA polymerase-1
MRVFPTTLGGRPVKIYAPRVGELSYARLRKDFPAGSVGVGLDMESTALTDAGVFDPDWRARLVQFGNKSKSLAYVLRMDDPHQVACARALLADESISFTSHTQIDPTAIRRATGVDISRRYLDSHTLAIMSAGDDRQGQADLKTVATAHGLTELKRADRQLGGQFCEMFNAEHPHKLNPDGTVKLTKAGAPAKRAPSRLSAAGEPPKDVAAYGFTNVGIDDPTYLVYAGLDALSVAVLTPRLIRKTGAPAHLLRSEAWLSGVALRMSYRGHRVDGRALADLTASTGAEVAEATQQCQEATGGLKPGQRERMIKFLTEAGANFDNVPTTDSGSPSLSVTKGHVALMVADSPDLTPEGRAAAAAVIRFGAVSNRFTVTKQIRAGLDPYGRIHPTLLTVGTITGRMAARGPNMQNFSKMDTAMRGLFLPEVGNVLCSTDFAQIELRVLAALAGEDQMISTILAGGDLHQLTADLLGITRQEAKTVNFLIVYGGGGAKLAAQIGKPVDFCKDVIRTYWEQYPAITEFKHRMESLDEIRLISGRRVPVGVTKNGESKSYANLNYQIQGSSRELLVGAAQRFSHGDPVREAMFWMFVHDEAVTMLPIDLAESLSHEIQEAFSFDFYGVPIEASSDILLDLNNDSRWMSGDSAVKYAKERMRLAA